MKKGNIYVARIRLPLIRYMEIPGVHTYVCLSSMILRKCSRLVCECAKKITLLVIPRFLVCRKKTSFLFPLNYSDLLWPSIEKGVPQKLPLLQIMTSTIESNMDFSQENERVVCNLILSYNRQSHPKITIGTESKFNNKVNSVKIDAPFFLCYYSFTIFRKLKMYLIIRGGDIPPQNTAHHLRFKYLSGHGHAIQKS